MVVVQSFEDVGVRSFSHFCEEELAHTPALDAINQSSTATHTMVENKIKRNVNRNYLYRTNTDVRGVSGMSLSANPPVSGSNLI